jgi:hypothetical protein
MMKTISVGETRRAARRHNFMIRVTVSCEGADHAGRVRDLSPHGSKIELDAQPEEPLARGQAVTVELRGVGRIRGEIVWRRAHWYGVRFARTIDPQLALRPVGKGQRTPDYVKPVVVRTSRALKNLDAL